MRKADDENPSLSPPSITEIFAKLRQDPKPFRSTGGPLSAEVIAPGKVLVSGNLPEPRRKPAKGIKVEIIRRET